MMLRNLLFRKKYLQVLLPSVIAFLFVATVTYGATTISTNINTAGTLTVSSASTLTGAVWATSTLQATGVVTFYDDLVVDTDTLFVDASTDRVGIGTTTPTAFFTVGEGAGTITGDIYMTGGLTVGATSTAANSVEGTILLANTRLTNPTGVAGMIYYNAADGEVRLYNGSTWGVIGTSTGFSLSGRSIRLSDIANNFLSIGTTSVRNAALATFEATSTAAIPLTLVARNAQVADLFVVHNAAATELFALDAVGNASTSAVTIAGNLWANGSVTTLGNDAADAVTLTGNASTTNALTVGNNFWVNGYATTTGTNGNFATEGTFSAKGATVTLGDDAADAITITGNASTTNSLTIGNTASTSKMIIGGNGSTVSGLIFGTCTFQKITINASSTGYADCSSATGIYTSDKVVVMATSSLPNNFIIQAASSTGAALINLRIYNAGYDNGVGQGASDSTGVNTINFIGLR